MRFLHVQLLLIGELTNENMAFKVKLFLRRYHSFTPEVIKNSFEDVGLCHCEHEFLKNLRKRLELHAQHEIDCFETEEKRTRTLTLLRCSDANLCNKFCATLHSYQDLTMAMTAVKNSLQSHRTTIKVLWKYAPLRTLMHVVEAKRLSYGGTTASWLT